SITTKNVEVAGRRLSIETGRVAEQANGAVIVRQGDSVVLSTVVMSKEPREGIDWFPLTCDYEEKLYAAGKIPGAFMRREGRPSEAAIIASRLTDRPLRPLRHPADLRRSARAAGAGRQGEARLHPDLVSRAGDRGGQRVPRHAPGRRSVQPGQGRPRERRR